MIRLNPEFKVREIEADEVRSASHDLVGRLTKRSGVLRNVLHLL